MVIPWKVRRMVSAFACRRSLVERSAGVIAQPVLVGVTRGTEAREIPGILVASSCRKAKGSGLLSRAMGLIVIGRRRSSFLAPRLPALPLVEPGDVEERETPPEIVVGRLPEGVLLRGCLLWKSAPEFLRVLAKPAKETDFVEDDGWLWTRIGTKLLDLANREFVRNLTISSHISCANLRSSCL